MFHHINLSPIPEIGYHSLTLIPALFCDGFHKRNGSDMSPFDILSNIDASTCKWLLGWHRIAG